MAGRDLVFFSYRHEDAQWLGPIQRALEPYVLADKLRVWSDKDIRVGARWHGQIQEALNRTRVGVVLISQNLFGSEYIRTQELPRLVADAEQDLLDLICVPVGDVHDALIGRYHLSAYQFTHDPEDPLSARRGRQREKAVVKIAMSIEAAYRRRNDAAAGMAWALRQQVRQAQPLEPARGDARTGSVATCRRAVLHDVPPLDDRHYVARDDALAHLRQVLVQGTDLATGVTSPGRSGNVGLHGMGGMGKTVLTQALCHDEEVRSTFPDGIFWLTLGQQPALLEMQNRLLRAIDREAPAAESVSQARELLKERFNGKRVLLVVDDLWNAAHFQPFDVAGGQSRVLITTRDASVLTVIGAREHPLARLESAQAAELLAQWAGAEMSALPEQSRQVAELCGHLPLALALSGAQVADGVSWETLVGQLKLGKLEFLDHEYGSVYKSLGLSVDALAEAERARYLELAVFPEDARIPMQAIARLWQHTGGLDVAAVEKLLARLHRKALLTLVREAGRSHVVFHDLQHDFVRLRTAGLVQLNGLLLDAYRSTLALPPGATAWAGLPRDEPYLWPRLAAHLATACRHEELQTLLLSLDWIRARLAVSSRTVTGRVQADVYSLLADYDELLGVPEVNLVRRALRMSTHVIASHPEQAGLQLYGRLGTSDSEAIQRLCAELKAQVESWPLVPLQPSLTPPGPLRLTLTGHENTVRGAALLTDGRRALSWSDDYSLKLWDLDQGTLLHSLVSHKSSVNGAALLSDGRRALSWSEDRSLKLWDLERGTLLNSLTGHKDKVTGAALLADGRRALSWSEDCSLKLWNLEQGMLLHTLASHEGGVYGAALLADGRRALSWAMDRSLKVWDLEQGTLLHSLAGHKAGVYGAVLLADGRWALSWSWDRSLKLWDLEQGTLLQSLVSQGSRVNGVVPLAGGRRALSWWTDGSLKVWDLEQCTLLHSLAVHRESITGAALLTDGRRTLSWSRYGRLELWDLEQGTLLQSLEGHRGEVAGAVLLADDRWALSWSHDLNSRQTNDRILKLWDLQQGTLMQRLVGHEARVHGVVPLASGREALSWSDDRSLKLWDLDQGMLLQSLTGHRNEVAGVALLVDGRRVLSWAADDSLKLWDLKQGTLLHSLTDHTEEVGGASLLADGWRALSWWSDGCLRLWDLMRGTLLHILVGHRGEVSGAVPLADGRRALSWSDDCSLKLWDLERGTLLHSLVSHKGRVNAAVLLADGRQALSWSDDRSLKLWDLERGILLHSLASHRGDVTGAALLSDGRRALSWSEDGSLKLWDLEQGTLLRSLEGYEGRVNGAVLLADGRRALSWSDDRSLKLWDLEQGALLYSLAGHEDWVNGAALLAGGRRALSWSLDHSLKLWDLEQGTLLHSLTGHEGRVKGAALLAYGRRALSWSQDRSVKLWDLQTGKELGFYLADAGLSVATIGLHESRILAGDALGRIHCLRLRKAGSTE